MQIGIDLHHLRLPNSGSPDSPATATVGSTAIVEKRAASQPVHSTRTRHASSSGSTNNPAVPSNPLTVASSNTEPRRSPQTRIRDSTRSAAVASQRAALGQLLGAEEKGAGGGAAAGVEAAADMSDDELRLLAPLLTLNAHWRLLCSTAPSSTTSQPNETGDDGPPVAASQASPSASRPAVTPAVVLLRCSVALAFHHIEVILLHPVLVTVLDDEFYSLLVTVRDLWKSAPGAATERGESKEEQLKSAISAVDRAIHKRVEPLVAPTFIARLWFALTTRQANAPARLIFFGVIALSQVVLLVANVATGSTVQLGFSIVLVILSLVMMFVLSLLTQHTVTFNQAHVIRSILSPDVEWFDSDDVMSDAPVSTYRRVLSRSLTGLSNRGTMDGAQSNGGSRLVLVAADGPGQVAVPSSSFTHYSYFPTRAQPLVLSPSASGAAVVGSPSQMALLPESSTVSERWKLGHVSLRGQSSNSAHLAQENASVTSRQPSQFAGGGATVGSTLSPHLPHGGHSAFGGGSIGGGGTSWAVLLPVLHQVQQRRMVLQCDAELVQNFVPLIVVDRENDEIVTATSAALEMISVGAAALIGAKSSQVFTTEFVGPAKSSSGCRRVVIHFTGSEKAVPMLYATQCPARARIGGPTSPPPGPAVRDLLAGPFAHLVTAAKKETSFLREDAPAATAAADVCPETDVAAYPQATTTTVGGGGLPGSGNMWPLQFAMEEPSGNSVDSTVHTGHSANIFSALYSGAADGSGGRPHRYHSSGNNNNNASSSNSHSQQQLLQQQQQLTNAPARYLVFLLAQLSPPAAVPPSASTFPYLGNTNNSGTATPQTSQLDASRRRGTREAMDGSLQHASTTALKSMGIPYVGSATSLGGSVGNTPTHGSRFGGGGGGGSDDIVRDVLRRALMALPRVSDVRFSQSLPPLLLESIPISLLLAVVRKYVHVCDASSPRPRSGASGRVMCFFDWEAAPVASASPIPAPPPQPQALSAAGGLLSSGSDNTAAGSVSAEGSSKGPAVRSPVSPAGPANAKLPRVTVIFRITQEGNDYLLMGSSVTSRSIADEVNVREEIETVIEKYRESWSAAGSGSLIAADVAPTCHYEPRTHSCTLRTLACVNVLTGVSAAAGGPSPKRKSTTSRKIALPRVLASAVDGWGGVTQQLLDVMASLKRESRGSAVISPGSQSHVPMIVLMYSTQAEPMALQALFAAGALVSLVTSIEQLWNRLSVAAAAAADASTSPAFEFDVLLCEWDEENFVRPTLSDAEPLSASQSQCNSENVLEYLKEFSSQSHATLFFSRSTAATLSLPAPFTPSMVLATEWDALTQESLTILFSQLTRAADAMTTRRRGGNASNSNAPAPSYILGRRLGSGSFGDVFEVRLEISGGMLAMKRVFAGDTEEGQLRLQEVQREIALLSNLCHRNIVRLSHTTVEDQFVCMFLELCDGSLSDKLLRQQLQAHSSGNNLIALQQQQVQQQQQGQLLPTSSSGGSVMVPHIAGSPVALASAATTTMSSFQVAQVVNDLLSALQYIHSQGVVHRDVKPDNVLFRNGVAKLSDFGSAVREKQTKTLRNMKGTLAYMAPEVLLGEPYGRPCDVWSVGCILAELLGVPLLHLHDVSVPKLSELYINIPLDGCLDIEEIPVALRGGSDGQPLDGTQQPQSRLQLPSDVSELLRSCFQRNPDARITAEGLLAHPVSYDEVWISQMRIAVSEVLPGRLVGLGTANYGPGLMPQFQSVTMSLDSL